MAKVYKNKITTTAGFNYPSEQPLDDREVVESYEDLATLVSSHLAYEGIEVYVVDNGKSYKLIDGSWKPVATELYVDEKIASLVDSAPETLDTLGELATALKENEDVVNMLNSSITNKVDKVEGKNLSTNDFTDEYKEKLDNIDENISIDWNSTLIENKPSIRQGTDPHSIIEGQSFVNKASGQYAHSEGEYTWASGHCSHAEGSGNSTDGTYLEASGFAAHAEGFFTHAAGQHSHSEGRETQTIGDSSHSEGFTTTAGSMSYRITAVEGDIIYLDVTKEEFNNLYESAGTEAKYCMYLTNQYQGIIEEYLVSGRTDSTEESYCVRIDRKFEEDEPGAVVLEASHLIIVGKSDLGNFPVGTGAHAEGYETQAQGAGAHSEGISTVAYGKYAHAEGHSTKAGYAAHSEGYNTSADGQRSHAEGANTVSSGTGSHAEGFKATASGDYSHAEGNDSDATGGASHAEGTRTLAEGSNSHAEGKGSQATNAYAHAEGNTTYATGESSHAEGVKTYATNTGAHAEGYNTYATGSYSHTEGYATQANANFSHAEGRNAVVESTGAYSHVEGQGTVAKQTHQHVQGKFNIPNENSDNVKYAHIVGNGKNQSTPSNAHTLDWDGNAWYAGDVTVGANKEKLATENYTHDTSEQLYYRVKAEVSQSEEEILATSKGYADAKFEEVDRFTVHAVESNGWEANLPAYSEVRILQPSQYINILGFNYNTKNVGNDSWTIVFDAIEDILVYIPEEVTWAIAKPDFTAGYTYHLSFMPLGSQIIGFCLAKETPSNE